MKNFIGRILMPVTILIAFQNCASHKIGPEIKSINTLSEDDTVTAADVNSEKIRIEDFNELQYYKGGWTSVGGQPNWSHSYTVNLASGDLTAKILNDDEAECSGSKKLLRGELEKLKSAYSSARIDHKKTGETQLLNAGTEAVTLRLRNPTTHIVEKEVVVQLERSAAAVKDLVVKNPDRVSNMMQALTYAQDYSRKSCN